MKRTEEIMSGALEAYPENISYSTVIEKMVDYNNIYRKPFIEGAEWADKNPPNGLRAKWYKIPKDKNGFFDDDSDLYDRLPIIITEEFKDFINLYYIDKENWHETVADFSRQRFVHYIEVRELKTK